tara:strand:+ start:345 stop:515 length:171 start_codon:yes stop_codon:yes gene_type:complete
MKEKYSQKNGLLEKLKKIGDLTIENCSHSNDEIKENAKSINRLAHDCYKVIKENLD